MVAEETRAADNTKVEEEEEEEMYGGRGLRVAREAMSKLFAYAEGGGGTWKGRRARRRRKRKRREGGGEGGMTMEVEERVPQWSSW